MIPVRCEASRGRLSQICDNLRAGIVRTKSMDAQDFRQARNHAGLSQQQAAVELRISQSYLSMLEKGQRPLSQKLARRMVQVYKLSPTSLPPSRASWQPKMVSSAQ